MWTLLMTSGQSLLDFDKISKQHMNRQIAESLNTSIVYVGPKTELQL